jgi:drug/metabolite transporter (DMT)-like permease
VQFQRAVVADNRAMPSPDPRPAAAGHHALPLIAGLAVILTWGVNFPIQKALFGAVTPLGFLGLRYLLVPLCAVALLLWRCGRDWPRLTRPEWLQLARLALIGQALHLLLSAFGMAGSTAFSASVLLACGPVFTLLILRLSGLERLARLQIAGVALACCGALLFTADKLLAAEWRASLGDAVLLLAAALFSYYTVAGKPLIQRHGGVTVLAYGSLICTLPMLAVCGPSLARLPWGQMPHWVWAGTVWNVVGGGFLGWLAWGWANERRGVARTAPLIYLMPLVAGVASWGWGGERFTAHKLLAAGIILAGVALAQFTPALSSNWRASPPPPEPSC